MAKKETANVAAVNSAPKQKKTLSAKVIILLVSAIAILATVITATVLIIVDSIRRDDNFDYITSDLTKYVDLTLNDYKNYELELSIAKPHEIDLDVALLNLISSEEYRKLEGDGAFVPGIEVTPGDKITIRYRGYTIVDGVEKTVASAMSNFIYDYDTELQIGDSNTSFPVGFELGLIGKNGNDYAKFEKITSGKAADHEHGDDWVVYVSFERLVEGGDSKKDTLKATSMRIDLADEDVDETFGEGFVEKLKSFNIGDVYNNTVLKIKGKNYEYSNLTIDFATTCEKAATSANGKAPLVVEGYFPYDFGIEGTATAGLRNETVYYQVYINQVQRYSTPELNEEFILKVIGEKGSEITEKELREEYEGKDLVEKYKAYAKELINKAYEEAYDIMVEDAMWNHYLKKAKIKKYPESKVKEIYNEYFDDVYYQYDYNGGSLQDSEGNFTSYDTVDAFAVAYLGLAEGVDWKDTLYTMSENLVKERLVLYYIMKMENILPSSEKLAAKVDEIKKEYFDEYIKQYLEYQDKTKEDFTETEYQQFLKDREEEIFEYYDQDYFEETAYYEIALETLKTYPTVYTLDNPKPIEIK